MSRKGASNSPLEGEFPTLAVREVSQTLSRWFILNARDLPWRRTRTPWGALVSEVMLQQTQLARVVEYWPAFMKRFPSPKKLAGSDESVALAAWQGLGYYRRVRLLRAAAAEIVQEHSGETPSDRVALEALPGVGRYTAGAVASIVSGHAEAIVDANVARVFLRIGGVERAANDRAVMRWCWSQAERFAESSAKPGVANEALMEFGGRICTPKAPRCSECPLQKRCKAYADESVANIPVPKQKAARVRVYMAVALAMDTRSVVLEQRGAKGMWGSMWQPPSIETAKPLTRSSAAKALGVSVHSLRARETFTFHATHREIVFQIYDASLAPSKFPPRLETTRGDALPRVVVGLREISSHAMSSPMRALFARIRLDTTAASRVQASAPRATVVPR